MEDEIFIRKKELYDKEKKAKKAQSKRRTFLKSFKNAAVWITVILTIIFTGAGVLISIRGSTPRNNTTFSLEDYIIHYPIQGRDHIEVGQSHPNYNSNPPTSGWHYEEAAEWGIYDKELPDEQLVHNLEHCGIWISYQPTIPVDQKEALVAFAKAFPSKVILTPRSKNDSPIALASWGILMKLNDYNQDLMTAFLAAFLNKNGPECSAM